MPSIAFTYLTLLTPYTHILDDKTVGELSLAILVEFCQKYASKRSVNIECTNTTSTTSLHNDC